MWCPLLSYLILFCYIVNYVICTSNSNLVNKMAKHLNCSEKVIENIFQGSILHNGNATENNYNYLKISHDKPIRIGILGGSISCGHGATNNNGYAVTLEKLNIHDEREIKVTNGAIPATGAFVANVCTNTILDEVDIIIVEYSINEPFQHVVHDLLLNLLQLPSKPIIIVLDIFSEWKGGLRGKLNVDDNSPYELTGATKAAIHLDISVISMRSALYPFYNKGVYPFSTEMLFPCVKQTPNCLQHMQDIGHDIAAYILYNYISGLYSRKGSTIIHYETKKYPSRNKFSICNSGFCLGSCTPYRKGLLEHIQSVHSLSALVIGPSEHWDIVHPQGNECKIGLRTNTINAPITFGFHAEKSCNLVLTALACSSPPYCSLGSFDVSYHNDTKYIEAYALHQHNVQAVVWRASVTPGYHVITIVSSSKSTSGYNGVELIGLYCMGK